MRLRLASLAVGVLGVGAVALAARTALASRHWMSGLDVGNTTRSMICASCTMPRLSSNSASTPVPPKRSEAEIRDLDIQFYEARARRDPTGAMDLARVAQLYLVRSRESGNYEDVLAAEHAARRSLRNRISRNAMAAQVLASSLLSEHRFAEALGVSRSLQSLDPDRLSYRAMSGEIAV